MEQKGKYLLYQGLLLPAETHSKESLQHAVNMHVRHDDVYVVTYPKSGTTWMQEILPLIMNGGDLTRVQTIPNWDRVPWLEETRAALVLDTLPTPRCMVTHLPYHLMPTSFFSSRAKVIYITRNPKDVAVSSFYFHNMATFLDEPGTFDEFLDKFLSGEVLFGKWTDHVKSWRDPALGDRILYLTYDEMIQDLKGAVFRISSFLGRDLSADVLEKVAEHCSFSNMKKNVMSNYSLVPQDIMDTTKSQFLRKGVSGDWKNNFSPEQEQKFSAVITEEMKDSNVRFQWDD